MAILVTLDLVGPSPYQPPRPDLNLWYETAWMLAGRFWAGVKSGLPRLFTRLPRSGPVTEPVLREPEQIRQDCVGKLCPD